MYAQFTSRVYGEGSQIASPHSLNLRILKLSWWSLLELRLQIFFPTSLAENVIVSKSFNLFVIRY